MRLFIVVLWSPAGKGLTSLLSFVMSNCEVVILGQVWCLFVSIPDLCPLSYFFIVEYAEMGRDDVTWHTVTSLDEHVRES